MNCQFCDFSGSDIDVLAHVLHTHNGHPSFSVSCKLCGGTWKKYESFKRHVFRKHPGSDSVPLAGDCQSDVSGRINVDEATQELESYNKRLTEQSAVLVLRLKSLHGVTQSCISEVITQTNGLIKTACMIAHNRIINSCIGIQDALRQEFARLHKEVNVCAFQGLESQWKQMKYFKEIFGMVEPLAVPMGQRVVIQHGTGCVKSVTAYGYCVPFLQTIRQLLQLPEIRSLALSGSNSDSSEMYDFKDGVFCRQDPIFSVRSLKILGYYDDVEVVNPIGAHTKKHKLSLFFWTLLNIPPSYRSRLSCINVIAVAKAKDCRKFGVNSLLQNFISDLNTLHSTGIEIDDGPRTIVVKGGLVAFSGDTLASNLIGGFKEGVGFANKICRTCEITSSQSKWVYFNSDCVMRDPDEHRRRCHRLETCLTDKARKYWSRVYGINTSSVLLNVTGFCITEGLIHDPMHLLYEGITTLQLKLLLKHLIIDSHYFNILQLNCALEMLIERIPSDCRPNLLEIKQLQSAEKLKQTASQIRWLSHLLPLAVADKVPSDDEYWCNYIRLLQIQQLCTSPVATESTVESLTIAVARHNRCFQKLYPEFSNLPKLHYLIHLPKQIQKFGPARHHWCMRMEAKNAFFKRKKLRNTKNVPKSVAVDHQLWACCMQRDNTGQPNARFLRLPPSASAGVWHCADTYDYVEYIKQHVSLSAGDSLLSTSEAAVLGVTYKLNDVVMLSFSSEVSFAQILDIVVSNEQLVCIGYKVAVEFYDSHINSFVAHVTTDVCSFEPSKLPVPWPVYYVLLEGKIFLSPFNLSDVSELV